MILIRDRRRQKLGKERGRAGNGKVRIKYKKKVGKKGLKIWKGCNTIKRRRMGGQDGNTIKHILKLREMRKYIFFKGIGASANWLNYEYFNKPGLDEPPPLPPICAELRM